MIRCTRGSSTRSRLSPMCEAIPVPVVCCRNEMIFTRTMILSKPKGKALPPALPAHGSPGCRPRSPGARSRSLQRADLRPPTGRRVQHTRHFLAHPPLKIRRSRIPRKAKHQHHQQQQQAAHQPSQPHGNLPAYAPLLSPFAGSLFSSTVLYASLKAAPHPAASRARSPVPSAIAASLPAGWSPAAAAESPESDLRSPSSFGAVACCFAYSGSSVFS